MPIFRMHADITTRSTWYAEAEDEETAAETAEAEGVPDRAMGRTLESNVEVWVPAKDEEIPGHLLTEALPTSHHDIVVEDEYALNCRTCKTRLCDVEISDSFESLAGVVSDHIAGVYPGEPIDDEEEFEYWVEPRPEVSTDAEPIGPFDDETRALAALVDAGYDAEHWSINRHPIKTWTFFGHWQDGKIVIEDTEEGTVRDLRQDNGEYPQGMWAAAGTGRTIEEAEANVRYEYE